MVSQPKIATQHEIIYPDSDGKPMAENTIQFRWIMTIYHNLAWLFALQADVFVAGDLLWYPVEGNNKIRQAPDVMVVFGVEKGDRGSYQQWKEKAIAPQVVLEILSPGNRPGELTRKLLFYDRYGVEEYYIYDPENNDLSGCIRSGDRLAMIEEMQNWVSPRLQVRFELSEETLTLYNPQGQPFSSPLEIEQQLQQERSRAKQVTAELEEERSRAEQERLRAEQVTAELEEERSRAEQMTAELEEERRKAKRLEMLLREAGIDGDRL
ncbi:Uma2 family endonuclease [Limnospira platensis]|uniref:Uma2 family endonuclease n=1 Tax=Limnospira platensis TaxID=118562 RepID=UPI0021A9F69C|nr:Putative restriction endonuclease [Arthrospira platensis C1]